MKFYLDYFGYDENDFKKYNLHPATDEEIEQDYINDLKEVEFDKVKGRGKYTLEEHNELVKRVNEFNKANDLPLVSF